VTIRIPTDRLLDFLADLAPTASGKVGMRGILLHTARGPYGDDPGLTTLLVGTSASGRVVGHTHIPCGGELEPTLIPIADVLSIRPLLEARAKADANHSVEITRDLATITLEEPPDLFAEGNSVTLHVADLDLVPRHLWELLGYDYATDPTTPQTGKGDRMPAVPRSDFSHSMLAPFLTVAKRHNLDIELYRYHQHRPTLVQIGHRYRGAIMPERWARDMSPGVIVNEGTTPGADLYDPGLPPPTKKPAGPAKVIDFRPREPELPLDPGDDPREDDMSTEVPAPGKPAPPTFETTTT
jgi:hypothetical protein